MGKYSKNKEVNKKHEERRQRASYSQSGYLKNPARLRTAADEGRRSERTQKVKKLKKP